MTADPLPPDDDTPQNPLGIDPELIKELDAKSKEIVDEAVAAGTLGRTARSGADIPVSR